jgi:alpha-glucuronidase
LPNKAAKIGQSIGDFGGVIVKADGFVFAPHGPPIALHYM